MTKSIKIIKTSIISVLTIFISNCSNFLVREEKNIVQNNTSVTHLNSQAQSTTINKQIEPIVINAFGDSLTAGYGVNTESSYPKVLEKKLKENGYNYKVINSGVSGETTGDALKRVNRVLDSKPEIIILTLGANDAFRNVSINKVRENLSQMIEKFQANKIKVILGGMYAPRFLGKDYYTEFDKIYPELAKKYSLILIPFFLNGVAMHSELNLADGAHPNANGYKLIVENNIWQYLKPALTI